MQHKVEIDFHGRPLSIEVGRLAKQASGAALVQYGETVVLTTAVASQSTRPGIDFFPLTVDYQEKAFAAGKIPGGFFKREGRQGEKEILTSRLIDRPIRPLFAEGYKCETQIIATVLSFDKENDSDTVAMLGASTALHVSDIPFLSPIAGVRIGRIGGKFVINPYLSQMGESDLNLLVAGTRDSIVMVEGGARMLSEDVMLDALYTALDALQPLIAMQEELRTKLGKPKREVAVADIDANLRKVVEELALPRLRKAMTVVAKMERRAAVSAAHSEVRAAAVAQFPEQDAAVNEVIEDIESRAMREMIVTEKKRVDGRGVTDIRPISCEVDVLPRTHGSSLFTRGETQALATTTLGTASDEQRIDALIGEHYRKFMLHYNFPPFSVGETKPLRGPSRRDTGHGALAERALTPVLPDEKAFPYTIRIVSEILESNGSSSMATVCSGSLSLMDAGVPIKAPVAGIAMGLIKEGEDIAVLSDILGDEDHLGDMDFKVAGTAEGITALQMDIKIHGVTKDIMRQALTQAREGRLHILNVMNQTLNTARGDISAHAPRIVSIKVRQDKIRDIIGPGGKVIRGIVEETGCKIDIEDDGTVFIASSEEAGMKRAIEIIEGITMEAQVGKIYKGKVVRIVDFGAFVEIMPGTDGLLHISQIGPGRVQRVSDVLKEGDEIPVKVLEIDKSGKIRLSRKEAMTETGQPAGGS
ncbi:polyribonucleotide nucleotidyltransferase [bacterium]|nr:polyribonucleotide nucleotidyltransferase [bacterium]